MKRKLIFLLCVTFLIGSFATGCQTAARRPVAPEQTPNQTANVDMTETERRALANRLAGMAEQIDGVQKASVVVSTIGVTDNNMQGTNGTTAPGTPGTITPGTPGTGTPGNTGTPAVPRNTGVNTPRDMGQRTGITNITDDRVNTATPGTVVPRTGAGDVNQSGVIVMVGITLNQNVATTTPNDVNNIKRTVANRLRASDRRISQVLVTTDANLITRINDVANGIIQGRPIQTFENDISDISRRLQMQQPAF